MSSGGGGGGTPPIFSHQLLGCKRKKQDEIEGEQKSFKESEVKKVGNRPM